MSQYGNLKHIVDLETVLGWKLSNIDFTSITDEAINYSWGDESDLITWIKHKDDKTQFNGSFYSISGEDKIDVSEKSKYPLMWLDSTGFTSENTGIGMRFNNVNLWICSNTDSTWLNSTRWNKKIPKLQALANHVISNLVGDVKIFKDRGVLKYGYRTRGNIGIGESGSKDSKSKALDIWDAVIINMQLVVSKECRSQDYFDFCNK